MQYGSLSRVYDELIYDMPYEKWAEFIFNKVPLGAKALELGCGTGNLTKFLAKRFDVTAIDISEQMLIVAQEKLRKSGLPVNFVAGDMTDFSLHKPVDCALCACDGINYLLTPEKVAKAFSSVRKSLKTGGLFIFDISSEYKLTQMDNQLYSEDAQNVTYVWRNSFDKATKCINMDITFFVANNENTYTRFDEVHVQRAHSVSEIQQLLKDNGFETVSVTEDYSLSEITDESLRITFCAKAI